jgi:hypothetical protein
VRPEPRPASSVPDPDPQLLPIPLYGFSTGSARHSSPHPPKVRMAKYQPSQQLWSVVGGCCRPAVASHSRGRGFDSPRLHSRFRALASAVAEYLRRVFAGGVRKGVPRRAGRREAAALRKLLQEARIKSMWDYREPLPPLPAMIWIAGLTFLTILVVLTLAGVCSPGRGRSQRFSSGCSLVTVSRESLTSSTSGPGARAVA